MNERERDRWNRARGIAERQRCGEAAACEYADWIIEGIRAGYIVLPAKHSDLFAQWYAHVSAVRS